MLDATNLALDRCGAQGRRGRVSRASPASRMSSGLPTPARSGKWWPRSIPGVRTDGVGRVLLATVYAVVDGGVCGSYRRVDLQRCGGARPGYLTRAWRRSAALQGPSQLSRSSMPSAVSSPRCAIVTRPSTRGEPCPSGGPSTIATDARLACIRASSPKIVWSGEAVT